MSETLIVSSIPIPESARPGGPDLGRNPPAGSPPPLPPIVNAGDLVADTSKEKPIELIKGVLHRGLKGVVAGPSKAGKTWLLLDLAVSVASGLKWLSSETEKAKVLLVNFEIPDAFIRARLRDVAAKKGDVCWENLDVWTLRGHSAPYAELIPRMIVQIALKGYSLIILDPVYKGLGDTDENNASDIATLCNNLEQLCVQTNAALVYAHHYSKGNKAGKDALDRMSGSGVFARDADTIINLTPHEEENCLTVEVVLRNLPAVGPCVVERCIPVFKLRPDLDPQNLARGVGKSHVKAEAFLDLLEAPMTSGEWMKAAMDELGIKKTTFNKYRAELEKGGLIEKNAETKAWSRKAPVVQAGEAQKVVPQKTAAVVLPPAPAIREQFKAKQ